MPNTVRTLTFLASWVFTSMLAPQALTGAAIAGQAPSPACVPGGSQMPLADFVPHAQNANLGYYMVVFRRGVSANYINLARDRAQNPQGPIKAQIVNDYAFGFAVHFTQPPATDESLKPMIEELLGLCGVEFVEADQKASVDAVPIGLDRIDKRTLPLDGVYMPRGNGSGVHIYVIDSGIDPNNPQFGRPSRVSLDYPATGNRDDCSGHGTAVAGVIGGEDVGVANQVSLHSVRIADAACHFVAKDLADGIDWVTNAANTNPNHPPMVANISAHVERSRGVDRAVEDLFDAGVTVVVSAGNDHKDACGYSPGRVKRAVITAAAMMSESKNMNPNFAADADTEPTFTNFGDCVSIFAPGAWISTAAANGGALKICDPDPMIPRNQMCSGTSMAAAHVTGCAATYLQTAAAGTRAPDDVRKWLFDRGNHKGTGGKPDTPGWGNGPRLGIASPESPNPPMPPKDVKSRHPGTPNVMLYCGVEDN